MEGVQRKVTATSTMLFESVFFFQVKGGAPACLPSGDFQVSALEPLLCRVIYWRFDQIAKEFLEEDVGVAEVLSDSAIWLHR